VNNIINIIINVCIINENMCVCVLLNKIINDNNDIIIIIIINVILLMILIIM